jgi:coenzyme F420-0:L-glutamate ligase
MPLRPRDSDILVVSSKPLFVSYGNIINIDDITPSGVALETASRYDLDPKYVQLILDRADMILGGVAGVLLTIIDGILLPNGGIDYKNSPGNTVVIPPRNIRHLAEKIYFAVKKRYKAKVGVVISDSFISPLRRGTGAVAIATYGFYPVIDFRGKRDLFGREIKFTLQSLGDDFASAAHILMKEADEAVPGVLIRGVKVELIERDTSDMLRMPYEKCLYNRLYR